MIRSPQSATQLPELQKTRPNVHILHADITDVPSLKVCLADPGLSGGVLALPKRRRIMATRRMLTICIMVAPGGGGGSRKGHGRVAGLPHQQRCTSVH